MPYKNPKDRNVKREYALEKKRPGAHKARMERQRARRAFDKAHYDDPKDKDTTAEVREGKDLAHRLAISKGGSNKQGVFVQSAAGNRSFKRGKDHKVVSEISAKERKKKS